jgi:hypothetical protein
MAKDQGSNAILWFLAGLSLGSLVGVVFAPRGEIEDAREYLRKRARQARENASEWIDRSTDEVKPARRARRNESAAEAGTHGSGEPPPD